MPRIAYFVHGRGRGHGVRTRAVLRRLPQRHELRLYCAGSAYELLQAHTASEEVTLCAPGRGMTGTFARRFAADRLRLQAFEPDLVVSDGDGPSVYAAWSLGVPVLAIGHGLVFRHTRLRLPLPWFGRLREAVNSASSSWPASRRAVVHFAPVEPATAGTVVVRPDLELEPKAPEKRDDFILAYFRDDDGAEALGRLAARGHRVVWFGRRARAPRGVEVQAPDVDAFREALGRCRAVVGSAGNQLPAECAMLGLPLLALHREGDVEHAMNAQLIEDAGIGIGARFSELGAPLLRRFEADLDRDRSPIAKRTLSMRPVSDAIPEMVDELCGPAVGTLPLGRRAPTPVSRARDRTLTAPRARATRPLPKGESPEWMRR